jgi:multicomponent Na+:H+ antiporter subunit D
MINEIPPSLPLILGALLVPFFKGRSRSSYVLLLPVAAFYLIHQLDVGLSWQFRFFGFDITLLRVDRLSKIFGYIFSLNAFAAFLYGFYLKDSTQRMAALFYIGSALGVVFAGDLLSLYFFWEVMAVSSTFLILARNTPKSQAAALRYILVHIFGGLCLLAGIVLLAAGEGTIAFEAMADPTPATGLILLGILVNAAAPPFSAWLSDSYPEATVTGGVILSAYTTKTAVYALLRGFPGWDILVAVGCVMTIYGIIYALLENDMRRILAYSIINQVGFMVAGVGIGTAMSLNGSAAHAFCHIIYKSLLWMSAGSVLYMTGRSKCTELGGLYKTMPWTLVLGAIGALSISSFPGTSGFTSKSLIIEGAIHEHLPWVWLVLEIASAGVFLHAGIKFPYFVFFARDRGLRPGETHGTMLAAMGFMAFLCLFLGTYPAPLYHILPYDVPYQAYTFDHVISQLQLLMFSALVFFLFLPLLKRTETISLDSDWLYRKAAMGFYGLMESLWNGTNHACERIFVDGLAVSVSKMVETWPARLISPLICLYWRGRGLTGPPLARKKEEINAALAQGALPIGIGTGMTTLFIVVMFFLS